MLRGNAAYAGLEEALLTPPEVSVRVNAAKGAAVPAGADRVPWCPEGFYLPERPLFTLDPALHQGLYYVQDASSMVMAQVARRLTADGQPVRWLDACAAPGGKTTAALSNLPAGSFVLANEYDGKRARALVENIERWGYRDMAVSQGDTARLGKLTDFFDVVAVDAPCSGEDMMRKEAVAVSQWSPALVRQCAALQKEIIGNVWPSLRPGGVLVYSTCTFNRQEDEENVQWICDTFGAESVDLGLTEYPGVAPGIETDLHCARFMPGRVRGEGLFIAALRKPRDSTHARVKDVNALLTKHLNVVQAGITDYFVKGHDRIPTYALVHAIDLDAAQWPNADVDYPTALAILRGEPVKLDDAPRGIVLTMYNRHPLAFMKNLGNRANNLVPQGRRILSTTVPAIPVNVLDPNSLNNKEE